MNNQIGHESKKILLLGYSTRAAAESAFRADYSITSMDFFGDKDQLRWAKNTSFLRDVKKSFSIRELLRFALQLPRSNLIYTANLENYSSTIEVLTKHHTLLGNSSPVLNRVRNTMWLRDFCYRNRINYPQTYSSNEIKLAENLQGKSWLVKPAQGGGGHKIQFWENQVIDSSLILQEEIHGIPFSIQFLSTPDSFLVLDISEQLIGIPKIPKKKFLYAGNILPLSIERIPKMQKKSMQSKSTFKKECIRIVTLLTKEIPLVGYNGIDCILNKQGIWLLEVNPRPTAVIDLCDRRFDFSSIDLHCKASKGLLPRKRPSPNSKTTHYGKAIVYAHKTVKIPSTDHWFTLDRRDIPWPGSTIGAGSPICTVFAQADSRKTLLDQIEKKTQEVHDELI